MTFTKKTGLALMLIALFIANSVNGAAFARLSGLIGIAKQTRSLYLIPTSSVLTSDRVRLAYPENINRNNPNAIRLQNSRNDNYNREDNHQKQGWWSWLKGLCTMTASYGVYHITCNKAAYAHAQEEDPFNSIGLDELLTFKDDGGRQVWRPGRNDTWFSLDTLYDFLYKFTDEYRNEFHSTANWIKRPIRTDAVNEQNPNYYRDVIILIYKAYAKATPQEQSKLDEKITYIFEGSSKSEKNFSEKLEEALSFMLDASKHLPKEHHTLQKIAHIASSVTGKISLPDWRKTRPIASVVTRDPHLSRPSDAPLFDREYMVKDEKGLVEGYWAAFGIPHCGLGIIIQKSSNDYYGDKYPIVKANPAPMPDQAAFLEKLHTLEQSAHRKSHPNSVSPSRFEDIHVGDAEYSIDDPKTGKTIRWPEAFGPYYVRSFNVRPSREFYNFVMNYEKYGNAGSSSRVMESVYV